MITIGCKPQSDIATTSERPFVKTITRIDSSLIGGEPDAIVYFEEYYLSPEDSAKTDSVRITSIHKGIPIAVKEIIFDSAAIFQRLRFSSDSVAVHGAFDYLRLHYQDTTLEFENNASANPITSFRTGVSTLPVSIFMSSFRAEIQKGEPHNPVLRSYCYGKMCNKDRLTRQK